jgi:hypothetical protein
MFGAATKARFGGPFFCLPHVRLERRTPSLVELHRLRVPHPSPVRCGRLGILMSNEEFNIPAPSCTNRKTRMGHPDAMR